MYFVSWGIAMRNGENGAGQNAKGSVRVAVAGSACGICVTRGSHWYSRTVTAHQDIWMSRGEHFIFFELVVGSELYLVTSCR